MTYLVGPRQSHRARFARVAMGHKVAVSNTSGATCPLLQSHCKDPYYKPSTCRCQVSLEWRWGDMPGALSFHLGVFSFLGFHREFLRTHMLPWLVSTGMAKTS